MSLFVVAILILFIALSFLSIIKIIDKNTEVIIVVCFSVMLIILAGFRGDGIDKDYQNYKEIFQSLGGKTNYFIEPGFVVITKLVRLFSGTYSLLFLIFALLSVVIRVYGISKLSNYLFVSLLIYFCNTFIQQEVTQIRAGIASGLFLLSLLPLQKKNNVQFFAIAILAVLFHYTALVLFLVWFLDTEKVNLKVWVFILPLSYLFLYIGLSPINLYKFIPIEAIQAKVNTYILLQQSGDGKTVNVFSTLVLMRFAFIIYLLVNIEKLQAINKYAVIMTKIYVIAMAVLIIMSKTAAIALRFSEFFMVVEIVALPLIIDAVSPKYRLIPRITLIVFSATLLFFQFRSKTLLIF